MRDVGKEEVHHRYFFHLACDGDPPERWRRHEPSASELALDARPLFELFWADLPDGVPPLLADHDRMLRWLVELMGLAEYRPPARVAAAPDPSLPQALAHVRFLGGPPDAGKSTVAQLLVDRHRLQRYTFDNWAPRHVARMDPTRQPALHAFCMASMDERWVLPTPEQMAAQAIQLWNERFWMMVGDLLALPREPVILAEGPGLFPACAAQVIADHGQAIWLLPTREFKLASAARRDKPQMRHGISDHARAAENWLARDVLLGEHVRREVARLGLPSVVVDGALGGRDRRRARGALRPEPARAGGGLMPFTMDDLTASGNRGPVPLLRYTQREPTDHLAVMLPGLRSRCEQPLLSLPTQLLRDAGADVLWVRYRYDAEPTWETVAPEERRAWLRADVTAALTTAQADRAYRRITLVGKSLGTAALGHLLEAAPWPTGTAVEAVWLTPLTRSEFLRGQIAARPVRSLFVVGGADREHDPAGQEEVRQATGGEVLLIPGVRHALEGADVWQTMAILERILRAIAGFLGLGGPA
jgi:hypothetical protein